MSIACPYPGTNRRKPGLLALVILAHAAVILGLVLISPTALPALHKQALKLAWVSIPTLAPPKPEPPAPARKPAVVHKPAVAHQVPLPHPLIPRPSETAPQPELASTAIANDPPAPAAATAPRAAANSAPAPAPAAPQFRPDYLSNPRPEYPARSRALREQGRVLLKVLISAEGRAAEVRLHQSSGFERLDDAAMAAVRQWRFVPAKTGDTPSATWVTIPVDFALTVS